jgi:hypothetical protein
MYTMFVSKTYWGPGDARNQAGLERLRKTRDIAQAAVTIYEGYAAGTRTEWQENRPPEVALHYDQAEYLSERNSAGLTYSEG